MKQIVALAALAYLLAAGGSSDAQVVKQEPFEGKMLPGAVVLVDDGSCGKGKIKEVTGGEIGASHQKMHPQGQEVTAGRLSWRRRSSFSAVQRFCFGSAPAIFAKTQPNSPGKCSALNPAACPGCEWHGQTNGEIRGALRTRFAGSPAL
jgi:hypothetical protein